MTIRSPFLVAAIAAVALDVGAAELEQVSVPGRYTPGYGPEASDVMQGVLELEPQARVRLPQPFSLVASLRLRLDHEDQLEPGEPNTDTYSKLSQPLPIGDIGTAELRDLYVEYRFDNGLARFGKQQIVWGRLDGIKVLDVLNPQDFREFILNDFDRSRIGLWSAYVDASFGAWRGELAVIADGSGHGIPEAGAWYELTAPRFRFGATGEQPSPPVLTDKPGNTWDDTALGLRVSRQFNGLDVSAVARSGNDFQPLGRFDRVDGELVVRRFYDRYRLFGMNLETSMGPLALRAEYAYQPQRSFNTRTAAALEVVKLDQHIGAVAVDIDGPLGVFMNIQYLVDLVQNSPQSLVRPYKDRVSTLFLRRTFAYDTISTELRWFHSFEDSDDLLAFSIEYSLTELTRLRLAADFFDGSSDGLFGQFSLRDRITLGIEHTF